jgi:hypothetical protein
MATNDEKTRVTPRRGPVLKEAGKEAADVPQASRAGKKISFYCPSGHRVIADAGLAGKRGHCSTCKAPVIIPATSQPPPEPLEEPPAERSGPPASAGKKSGRSVAEEPVAGRRPPAAPSRSLPAAAGEPDDAAADASEEQAWDFIAGQAESPPVDGPIAGGWSPPVDGEGSAEENPTAMLVARLWAERDRGGTIELHLAGGSVILPEWYDHAWSRGTHGLFASQAADGSVTLTAVAWETIQKVVVRQLATVPDDMFI